jgi:hypothetical protein
MTSSLFGPPAMDVLSAFPWLSPDTLTTYFEAQTT